MSLKNELVIFFGGLNNKKVVILGIGSPIRHDDAVGLKIIDILEDKNLKNTFLLKTETVPESYTSEIRSHNPTHVILLDAAHFGGIPGEGRIIPTQYITNASVSTHSLPLTIFVNFIKKTMCSNVVLIGIQSVDISLGEGLTSEVEKGAISIAKTLEDLLA